MYFESPVYLNFCILCLFLVDGPQALYVNPGWLKRISDMNLFPANKTCWLFRSFYIFKTKYHSLSKFYLESVLLFLSYLMIHWLLKSHVFTVIKAAHFDESIFLLFLSFKLLSFYCFFLHLKQFDNIPV